MRNGHANRAALERRIHVLGEEIFERAAQAVPRWHQPAWWLEQMTRIVDQDPRLKAASFQFVDCLPALATDTDLARHLHEFMEARGAPLPPAARWFLRTARHGGAFAAFIGFCARLGAQAMAGRFITGHDEITVLRTLQRLRASGMAFTLDVLGESTTSAARADAYVAVYHDCLARLAPAVADWPRQPLLDETESGPQPRVNISVKLTGLHPHFDAIAPRTTIEQIARRLVPLLRQARALGAFVNIDIESFQHRLLTFELFESLLGEGEFRDFADVGIVVQAYLKSGEADLARLLDWARRRGTRFAIRLVKGAYWDSEVASAVRRHAAPPVWTRKWESDACYERMAETMLEHRRLIRPCFASHNVRTLAAVMASAERLDVPPSGYELQMLYGMGDPLKTAVARMGRCVRVYCPYGDMLPGMAYLIRRLLENTSNDSFLKQGFGDRAQYAARLADPAVVRPPSSPLPRLRYADPLTDPLESVPVFQHCQFLSFAVEENRTRFASALQKYGAQPPQECAVLAAGRELDAGETRSCVDPADPRRVRGNVRVGTIAEADLAVAALARSFDFWSATEAADRCAYLERAAELLESRRLDFAARLVLDAGLTWRQADAEVAESVDFLRFHAEQMIERTSSPRLRAVPGEENVQTLRAHGVCVVLADGAAPLVQIAADASAALCCGNTLLVCPTVQTAPLASCFVELLAQAGVPSAAVGLLTPADEQVELHLARHSHVRLISCHGSRRRCAVLRAASMEDRPGQRHARAFIGSVNSGGTVIIDDDADVDAAILGVLQSALTGAGQRRACAAHVIVVGDKRHSLALRMAEALPSWKVGPPSDPSTLVGPVLNPFAGEALRDRLCEARKTGAILGQGDAPAGDSSRFVVPTLIRGSVTSFAADLDRPKGPVMTLYEVDDFDAAVALANRGAPLPVVAVYSRSPSHVRKASHEIDADMVFINRPTIGGEVDRHPTTDGAGSGSPYAKGSGDYLLHFTRLRTLSEHTLRHGFSPQQEPPPGAHPAADLQHA